MRIIHITRRLAETSARIKKESDTLHGKGYSVDAFGFKGTLISHSYLNYCAIGGVNDLRKMLLSNEYDVVVSHNLFGLSFTVLFKVLLRLRFKIIYDAHELETYTGSYINKPLKKAFGRILERICMRHVRKVWVVSPSIRDFYKYKYPNKDIHIVYNFPKNDQSTIVDIERKIDIIEKGTINFVYQGKLTSGRNIERIINVFKDLPNNLVLNIFGFGPLEDYVRNNLRSNIVFHGSFSSDQLPEYMKDMHVGFSLLDLDCLNHVYALPNKLFNYINSGIFVLSYKNTDQADIIESHSLGKGIEMHDLLRDIKSISRDTLKQYYDSLDSKAYNFTWNNNDLVL